MASSPKFPTSVPLGTDGVPTDFNRNIYCNLKLPLGLENEDYPRESCEFPLERLPPFKDEYPGTCHRRRRCKSEGVDSERSQLHSRVMQNEMKKRSKIVDGHDLKPRRGHQCTNTEDLNCYQKNSRCLDVKRMNSLLSPYNGFYDNHNNQINPLSTITFKQLNELSGNQNHTRSREKYLNIWNQELSREFFCRSSSMNKSLENSCFGKSVSQSKTSSQSHFSHTGNSLYDELLLKDMKIQELYKKEMEVLRCKLNELQGGDAKRMRKQNECDLLGNSFGLTSCSVAAVEIKRPRDNSPVYYQFRNGDLTVKVYPSANFMNKYRISVVIENVSFDFEAVLPPYPNDECLSSCSLRDDGRRRLHEEEPCNTATMMIHFENESLRSIPSEHRPITNVLCPLDDSKRNGSQTNRIVNNIITNCSKKSKSDFCDFQSQTVPLKRQCKSTKFEEFSSPSTDSGSVISQCDEEEMRNISTHVKINSHLELRVNDLTDVINDSASTTVICSTNVPNPMCSSASSFIDIATNSDEPLCQPHPALRVSLFTNVPPYINFSTHSEKGVPLPANVQKLLKWKLSSITPVVVRHTILNSGFKLVRKSNEWTGTWGKHMKSICFKTLKDYQKMNHFPGSFQIGRKDRLWKNLSRLMTKFGKKEFGFTPRTFVLPQDTKLLRSAWEKNCGKEKWIIKPPASARGTGIKVIAKWGHIPRKVPLVVQKYIEKPYLINSTKFDLRLYVLVTSMNPLKIYMYDNGLVRFASVKYSSDPATLGERYMHLTNYSINKESSQYTQNQDADSCEGHKWTLKTLWSYLEREHKVPVNALWTSLVDVVIKTLICGESSISQLTQANLPSRYCAYELFGIDILFDHLLKPWLLEVNISPSLHSSSPLDLAVKGPLVRDLMNIIGFQIPPKLSGTLLAEAKKNLGIKSNLCYDKRLFTALISNAEREKQMAFLSMESREDYLDSILEDLTPDDVRHLVIYEDELTQLGSFQKVFPTPKTHEYHNFFEAPRYYNKLFDAWEVRYHKNRSKGIELLESKCKQKIHLDVSQINFNTTKGLGKRRKLGLIRNFNFSWKSQGKIPRCFIKNVKKSGENQKKIVSCTTNGSLPDQDKTHPSKEEKSTEVVNQSETVAVGSKISS